MVEQNGYEATTATSFAVTASSGTNVSNLNFGEFHTVTLSGLVFSDSSGSGVLTGADPGLSGWTVDLVNSANQVVATTTSTTGGFSFTAVGPGTYTVELVQQSGYLATTSTTFSVTAQSGANVSNLNVGEFGLVTLSGEVFDDNSGSGVLGSGDTGLSGWTVDLVNSANQVVADTTASNGTYSFDNLGPGTYTVRVVEQSGFDVTTPTSYSETAQSGTNVSNLNFGEFTPVTFSGEVYNDTNGQVLTLTTGLYYEASAGWLDTPVSTGSFVASFTYTDVTGGGSADGAAFVLQNDPSGSSAGWVQAEVGWAMAASVPARPTRSTSTPATPRVPSTQRTGRRETMTRRAPSLCKAAIRSTSRSLTTPRPRP